MYLSPPIPDDAEQLRQRMTALERRLLSLESRNHYQQLLIERLTSERDEARAAMAKT